MFQSKQARNTALLRYVKLGRLFQYSDKPWMPLRIVIIDLQTNFSLKSKRENILGISY